MKFALIGHPVSHSLSPVIHHAAYQELAESHSYGLIDVATDKVETADEVADVIGEVMKYVPKERIVACTNCGMAPMRRDIAEAKLMALGAGAKLARERFG